MNIEMGKVYWKIDNTKETFNTLAETLASFGITNTNQRELGTEMGFKRVYDWKTNGGLSFSTIWYINLCTLRFGDYESDVAEVTFDSIMGSYGPYADHNTIDFVYRGNTVFKLALRYN